MSNHNLIQNAVYCTDTDTYYVSKHRHDLVLFESGGKKCYIDGGNDYCRCTVMPPTVTDWSLYADTDISVIKGRLLWGTYGIDGNDSLKYVPLSRCTTDHLHAILGNVANLGSYYTTIINMLLSDRSETTLEESKIDDTVIEESASTQKKLRKQ